MTNSPSLSGPVFKFSRETNAVRVENVPDSANRLEILALFRTLIGDIRSSQDLDDALEITFFTGENARKALCMSGYSIAGSTLLVTPIVRSASPALSQGGQVKRNDTRRNLYVLGIPFGMTNQSLTALFSSHGTVSHCVILATLDGASRRRGFVVMSTHEEARRVMTALGRNSKASGGLDVSWAVVQRSKGFLDGGDRAGVVSSPPSTLSPPSHLSQPMLSPDAHSLPPLSTTPTPMILLANLPSLLFDDDEDLRGLVCPFGSVKKLHLVKTPLPAFSLAPTPIATSTAVVHYATLSAAQDALRALNGESYADCTIRVTFLADPEVLSVPASPFPQEMDYSRFEPAFSSIHCGPPLMKTVFDGRNLRNFVPQDSKYQWNRPTHLSVRSLPSFARYDTFPRYGEFAHSWLPTSLYARAPSRDLGYCV